MKVLNIDNDQIVKLTLINPETGCCWVEEFIAPGVENGNFIKRHEDDYDERDFSYTTGSDALDLWQKRIRDQKQIYDLYETLKEHLVECWPFFNAALGDQPLPVRLVAQLAYLRTCVFEYLRPAEQ